MKSTFIEETIPGKFTFNVLLQMQERSSQLLEKYKLVHRRWQRDIVCGKCNQDLDREKRQFSKASLLMEKQVIFVIKCGHA